MAWALQGNIKGPSGKPDPVPLRAWRAAVSKRFTDPADVLIIGHSISEGFYATVRRRRWVELLRDRLKACYGPGSGVGYVPAMSGDGDAAWGSLGGWVRSGTRYNVPDPFAAGFGLGRKSFSLGAAGEYAELKFVGDRVWALYTGGPGTGGLRILLDGVEQTKIDTKAAAQFTGKWDSGPIARASSVSGTWPHVLRVEPVGFGAAPAVINAVINGAMVFDGDHDAGVRMWDGAHAGYTSIHFDGTTLVASGWAQSVPFIQPSLVLFDFATNEYGQGIAPATMKTAIGRVADQIIANTPIAPSFVIIVDWVRGDGTYNEAGWLPYRDVMLQLASERGWAVADVYKAVGTIGADPYALTTDLIHPNDAGAQLYLDVICEALGVPDMEAQMPEMWRDVGATSSAYSLAGVAFADASLTSLGFGIDSVGYRRTRDGVVQLKGCLWKTGGTVKIPNGTLLFTLPVGYRPTTTKMFSALTDVGQARLDVNVDGTVKLNTSFPAASQATWISLEGVSFDTPAGGSRSW